MLRNYFLVAYRNLFRNKVFSLINVSGLALGMADLSAWMFNLPAVAVLSIALLSVSFQSVKASLLNPVDCLRSE